MERFLDYFNPTDYWLELYIFTKKRYIRGTVIVDGELASTAQFIKLHAVDMKIRSVNFAPRHWMGRPDDSSFQACEYKYSDQELEIPLTSKILTAVSEQAKINHEEDCDSRRMVSFKIEFEAPIKSNMQGCYLSSYEYNGEKRELVATQFESHYAREAFPCIDEPAAKARFELVLITPDIAPGDVVLANTPLLSKDTNRYTFEVTPRMSTYLLAWVIGPLKSVSTVNECGVKITSYCTLNHPTESLLFANDTAARALEYFDEKFGHKYPLPKLDQVALPDFEAGAMENWGLVTYRESCLLADTDAALDTKQSVAVTVTHELSHQWFGDLVTMSWWDDLWLNESFATIMEYCATDALYPDFNIWQDFFTGDCLAALRRDSLPGVQAVQQAVHHPAEIATLFDSAIVYAKGARLILMLIRLLGEEKFDQGIRAYFQKFQYQNTVGDDLWAALQPHADFDVREFMHEWISQPGFPMLENYSSHDIKQQRFLLDGSTDNTTWALPKVFDDMSGHYLLKLSDEEFQAKLQTFDDLSLERRLRLLIDRTLLAKTPAVASSSLLDLLDKFKSETSAAIWSILTSLIGDLKFFCPAGSPAESAYQTYLKQLLSPAFRKIDYGKIDNDTNATQLRAALVNVGIYARDDIILQNLVNLYQDDFAKISPELRASVLTAKMLKDETVFAEYLEAYPVTSDPELRADLLFTMGSFANSQEYINTMFDLLEKPDIVRPQDHIFLYIYLLRNSRTRERVLEWLTTHWAYIEQLTGEKSIEDYPRYAANLIRTEKEAQIFYNFFSSKEDDPILKRTLSMAKVEIDSRLALIKSDAPAVEQKLTELI